MAGGPAPIETTSRVARLRAAVSGSYKRFPSQVEEAVQALADAGADVLSPGDPRVVDRRGDFVFVASDEVRHLRTVQSRHFAAISASDLLWIVAGDGYVGTSTAMEIGFAAARGVPVFSCDLPDDVTVRNWVQTVASVEDAVRRLAPSSSQPSSLLIDPVSSILAAHDDLAVAGRGLIGRPSEGDTAAANQALGRLRHRLHIP